MSIKCIDTIGKDRNSDIFKPYDLMDPKSIHKQGASRSVPILVTIGIIVIDLSHRKMPTHFLAMILTLTFRRRINCRSGYLKVITCTKFGESRFNHL